MEKWLLENQWLEYYSMYYSADISIKYIYEGHIKDFPLSSIHFEVRIYNWPIDVFAFPFHFWKSFGPNFAMKKIFENFDLGTILVGLQKTTCKITYS